MKKTVTWLAWMATGLVAVLTALNWPTMIATAPFDLVVSVVHLPVGLLILALSAVPLALFFVAYLHQQISALMETRRLLKEVQRAHELADKAEASRVEGLRQLLTHEFRLINERLDNMGVVLPERGAPSGDPTGLRRILPAPWHGLAR